MEKPKSIVRSIHPLVAELESANEALSTAVANYCRSSNWVETLSQAISPGSWTRKVEAALGNEDELEKLRQTYREKALHFMTGYVQEVSNRGVYVQARIQVLGALRAVLSLYDSIEERRLDSWLRPVLQAACVSGDAEFTKQENLARGLPHDESAKLAAQVEEHVFFAFNEIREQARNLARKLAGQSDTKAYQSGRYGHDDVPQRNVFVTALDEDDKLPVNVQLFELMQKAEQAHRIAMDAAKFLKEENGKVNERQHANRMIDVLFDQDRVTCGVPSDPKAAVQDQNVRRVQYECSRHILLVAVRSFKEQYDATAALFAEAAEEAFVFCSRVHTERQQHRAVTNEIIAYRCVMNNLLAIELRLRRLAPELAEMTRVSYSDRASGAGADALSKEFERVAKVYRLNIRQ